MEKALGIQLLIGFLEFVLKESDSSRPPSTNLLSITSRPLLDALNTVDDTQVLHGGHPWKTAVVLRPEPDDLGFIRIFCEEKGEKVPFDRFVFEMNQESDSLRRKIDMGSFEIWKIEIPTIGHPMGVTSTYGFGYHEFSIVLTA